MICVEYFLILKNTYFEEHLQPAASMLLVITASTDLLFLIQNIMRDGFSEYVLSTLLVETIPTNFCSLICGKQKLVQSINIAARAI